MSILARININALNWFKQLYYNSRKRLFQNPNEIKEITKEENIFSLHDVFGITNEIPIIYTSRNYVDEIFKKALKRRKHIVIYGCSKQGKTSLRKKYLNDTNSIVIQCTNSTTRENIYKLILKEAGVELSHSKTETLGGTRKTDISMSGESSVYFAKTKVEGKTSIEKNVTDTVTKNYFNIDSSDVNDIIRVLLATNFNKWIVIEDFHYLSSKEQHFLSADLKAIYEKTDLIRVVVIGVWLETGKLTKLNGDLDGRTTHINADIWRKEELLNIIQEGEKLLNIFFSLEAKEKIVFYCENNVGLLHQITENICDKVGITKTQSKSLLILDDPEINSLSQLTSSFRDNDSNNGNSNVDTLLLKSFGVENPENFDKFNYHGGPFDIWLGELSKDRSPRYSKFLREFADGPKSYTGDIYKWLIAAIIRASHENLRNGLTVSKILDLIEIHFNTIISKKDLRSVLNKIREFHTELEVQPPILDFDTTEDTLMIVDSGLLLYHTTHSVQKMLIVIGLDPKIK